MIPFTASNCTRVLFSHSSVLVYCITVDGRVEQTRKAQPIFPVT
jgi:hypothetical protein